MDEENSFKQVVTLKFSFEEANRLVEILKYTKNTSDFLALQESLQGTEEARVRYESISQDSQAYCDYISASVNIGEPTTGEVH